MATFSTIQEADAAYLANADYEEVASVSKAKTFVTACIALRRFAAISSSNQGSSISIDANGLKEEIAYARSFIAANDTTSSSGKSRVRFLGTDIGFRG